MLLMPPDQQSLPPTSNNYNFLKHTLMKTLLKNLQLLDINLLSSLDDLNESHARLKKEVRHDSTKTNHLDHIHQEIKNKFSVDNRVQPDLIHLINSAEDLNLVLIEYPNKIITFILTLLITEPRLVRAINDIVNSAEKKATRTASFAGHFFEQRTAETIGLFRAGFSLISQGLRRHGDTVGNRLEELIPDEVKLNAVLKNLPTDKKKFALMTLRHLSHFNKITDILSEQNYQQRQSKFKPVQTLLVAFYDVTPQEQLLSSSRKLNRVQELFEQLLNGPTAHESSAEYSRAIQQRRNSLDASDLSTAHESSAEYSGTIQQRRNSLDASDLSDDVSSANQGPKFPVLHYFASSLACITGYTASSASTSADETRSITKGNPFDFINAMEDFLSFLELKICIEEYIENYEQLMNAEKTINLLDDRIFNSYKNIRNQIVASYGKQQARRFDKLLHEELPSDIYIQLLNALSKHTTNAMNFMDEGIKKHLLNSLPQDSSARHAPSTIDFEEIQLFPELKQNMTVFLTETIKIHCTRLHENSSSWQRDALVKKINCLNAILQAITNSEDSKDLLAFCYLAQQVCRIETRVGNAVTQQLTQSVDNRLHTGLTGSKSYVAFNQLCATHGFSFIESPELSQAALLAMTSGLTPLNTIKLISETLGEIQAATPATSLPLALNRPLAAGFSLLEAAWNAMPHLDRPSIEQLTAMAYQHVPPVNSMYEAVRSLVPPQYVQAIERLLARATEDRPSHT